MARRHAARACTGDVRTTCPYCGVGCGVLATPDGVGGAVIARRSASIRPTSAGCAPRARRSARRWALRDAAAASRASTARRVGWDARARPRRGGPARASATRTGPKSIAFYLSGQLLTEDYYVANKLAKGFIGTPHVDTNSRLCMASSVAGHRRAFGADVVPQMLRGPGAGRPVVLVGSNAAWCHPVLYQRIQTARAERGVRVVNIDPRRTATSEGADLHLASRPARTRICGTACWSWLADHGAHRLALTSASTRRASRRRSQAARAWRRHRVARSRRDRPRRARHRALLSTGGRTTPRVVTCYSQGVNQSAQGTDKVNAIINCHLATGRIGKPGAGPLSLTGQPNAMGGREVGGLANMLAAHMGFSTAERDRVAPLLGRAEPRRRRRPQGRARCSTPSRAARIKALWVMGTNPAVSLPRARRRARRRWRRLELLVVSENVAANDTVGAGARAAAGRGWGEKDGTVTNSERRISRQRAFLPLPGEARPDWWIAVRRWRARLGWGEAFAYRCAGRYLPRARARCRASRTTAARVFDISGLAGLERRRLRRGSSPCNGRCAPARRAARQRLFGDGALRTPTGRARFVAIEPGAPCGGTTGGMAVRAQHRPRARPVAHHDAHRAAARAWPRTSPSRSWRSTPTMRRASAWSRAAWRAWRRGTAAALLRVHARAQGQQPGSLFVPIHWSARTARPAASARWCSRSPIRSRASPSRRRRRRAIARVAVEPLRVPAVARRA